MTACWGCPRCLETDPAKAWAWLSARARPRRGLLHEPHFGLSVTTCSACGQRFARVFTERIDWRGGEDPQRTDLIPLRAEEVQALADDVTRAGGRGVAALLARVTSDGRRRLVWDWPSGQGAHIVWMTSAFRIPRHD